MKYIHLNALFLMIAFFTSCGQSQTNVPQDNIHRPPGVFADSLRTALWRDLGSIKSYRIYLIVINTPGWTSGERLSALLADVIF